MANRYRVTVEEIKSTVYLIEAEDEDDASDKFYESMEPDEDFERTLTHGAYSNGSYGVTDVELDRENV